MGEMLPLNFKVLSMLMFACKLLKDGYTYTAAAVRSSGSRSKMHLSCSFQIRFGIDFISSQRHLRHTKWPKEVSK